MRSTRRRGTIRCDPQTRPSTTPEGPYELGETANERQRRNPEMLRLLDFIEQLERIGFAHLHLRQGGRETRLIIHLVRNDLLGQLTTNSSLAAASGLSYGTALRTIGHMKRQGLIVERPRTTTGRSISLHPSPKLLGRWDDYARQCRILVGATFRLYLNDAEGTAKAAAPSRDDPPAAHPPVLVSRLALGRRLRILVHADSTFMAMNSLRRHFEMMFGTPIVSRALSIDRLHAEIIENSRRPVSKYDIVACDLPWFGEMATAGRLLQLDSLIAQTRFDLADFYDDALASTRYGGHQYGIPILMTAETLVYRTDLLAEAGIAVPMTVAETLEAARRLHDPRRRIFGLAWNGARGTPLGHSFVMIMGAFGRPVINLRAKGGGFDAEHVTGEEMRPMFLAPEAQETAEYLRALLAYSPPNVLNMSWYDRAAAFANGEAAMAYSHSLLASLFEFNEKSPAYRRAGYVPHPTGPSGRPIAPLGGYALTIPANIEPQRIAPVWSVLSALTSARAVKLYTMNGSLACPRRSVSGDPEIRALSPMLSTIDEMASRGLLKMWPRPPTPDIVDIIAIAGQEIHDALSGLKPIPVALKRAQNRADAIMRERGRY
jgi:multiple sugar transport system substrate-binding protein